MNFAKRYCRQCIIIFIGFCGVISYPAWSAGPGKENVGNNDQVISLTTARGCELLKQSGLEKYVLLSSQFVTQDNTAFCGVASSVMVLNALEIDRPTLNAPQMGNLWTQENFWSTAAKRIADPAVVRREGMTLDTLGKLLKSNGVEVKVRHCNDLKLDDFRAELSASLADDDSLVLLNYYRPAVGQAGGGHISPVAAYNATADEFLVLDVARYKLPPVWIPTKTLYQAASTVDASANASRGFVICRAAAAATRPTR